MTEFGVAAWDDRPEVEAELNGDIWRKWKWLQRRKQQDEEQEKKKGWKGRGREEIHPSYLEKPPKVEEKPH